MPEDKLEVVSVALIKWIEKDKAKDHDIYKIILNTVTKKLVKSYFKINSRGEVFGHNSEPFVPSAEDMQDEDEFHLLEESALYNVGKLNNLSIGYQFTDKFAFPIYYDYNPDEKHLQRISNENKDWFQPDDKNRVYLLIKDVFPGLECLVSAAVTNQDMAYVYCSFEDDGYVFQYKMDNEKSPNFTLIAKKAYKDVNAALPKSVSLVFTAEDKVVTMVHHFMIEQNSQTFFTQTEKLAKFGLINKYFGCKSENLEKKLTTEFVQNYIEFASPNSGVVLEPPDTQDSETVLSTRETHGSPGVKFHCE